VTTWNRRLTVANQRQRSGFSRDVLPAAAGGVEDEAGNDPEIIRLLTHTIVESPDLVAVFASVGHEALWANDAFVNLVPIREVDKI
jgi:hypothetical protein